MATRGATRRLDIEIGAEAKQLTGFKHTNDAVDKLDAKLKKGIGDKTAFKPVTDAADKAATKIGQAGEKAAESFSTAIGSAGETASDLFSGGFDVSAIADTITSKLGDLGGRGGKIATTFAGIGLAAGAAFTVGLLNGFETEVATDRITAQLGGSEWAADMGEVAGNLYLQAFGDSVAEVGQAVRGVVENILPEGAPEEVEALTAKLLTFTDVMEQDTNMAIQAMSNMLRTGIAKDGAEALDILTRGIQKGANRADDLLETFQEYSTMFREVGLAGEEAMGLIVQGLKAGARDADTVADALKEFAIRAQDGSELSAAGFKAIGLNAQEMTKAVAEGGPVARDALDKVLDGLKNMEDPAKRNAAAVALFGTKAEDLGDALFALDLDTAAQQLGTVEGATDQLGSAYDNASTKIDVFKREALAKLTTFIGNEVLPALEDLAAWFREDLQPALDDLGGWLRDNVPWFEDLANWLGENDNALKAVIISVTALTAGFVALKLAAVLAATASAAAWVIAALPILAIIGVIGLVVGAFAVAVQLIRQGLNKMGFDFSNAWGAIQRGASAAWQVIWFGAIAVFNRIKESVRPVVEFLASVARVIAGAWTGSFGAIARAAKAVFDWIIRTAETVARRVSQAAAGIKAVGGASGGFVSGISKFFASGGFVEGIGPQPIVAHGGELILNGQQQAGLWDWLQGGAVARGGGGGGDTYIFQLDRPIIASSGEFRQMVVDGLNEALGVDPQAVTIRGKPLS